MRSILFWSCSETEKYLQSLWNTSAHPTIVTRDRERIDIVSQACFNVQDEDAFINDDGGLHSRISALQIRCRNSS